MRVQPQDDVETRKSDDMSMKELGFVSFRVSTKTSQQMQKHVVVFPSGGLKLDLFKPISGDKTSNLT